MIVVDADRVSVAGKRFFSCIAMDKFLDALTEKVKFNDAAWKARLIFLFCIFFSRPLFPLSPSLFPKLTLFLFSLFSFPSSFLFFSLAEPPAHVRARGPPAQAPCRRPPDHKRPLRAPPELHQPAEHRHRRDGRLLVQLPEAEAAGGVRLRVPDAVREHRLVSRRDAGRGRGRRGHRRPRGPGRSAAPPRRRVDR